MRVPWEGLREEETCEIIYHLFISIYVCECSYVFMYVCVYLSIAGKEKLPFTPLGSLTGQ